jgi:hypothetical protein
MLNVNQRIPGSQPSFQLSQYVALMQGYMIQQGNHDVSEGNLKLTLMQEKQMSRQGSQS